MGVGAIAPLPWIAARRAQLRRMRRPAFFWATIGSLAGSLYALPQMTYMIAEQGYAAWLARGMFSSFVPGFILVFSLAAVIDSGTDLVARPGRFLLTLAIGAALSTGAIWAIDAALHVKTTWPLAKRLMDWWLTVMLFGGVFGWAAVLNIRRQEDQAKLDGLLARRSTLALRVAHSNLLTSRAKIDPEMVVRILKDVRGRYQNDAEDAGVLLDHMIGYLRLAMSRDREKTFSLMTELALVRAYIALREAEKKAAIGILVNVQGTGPGNEARPLPIFIIAKILLDGVLPEQPAKLDLLVEVLTGALMVGVDVGAAALRDEVLWRMRAELREMPGGATDLTIRHENDHFGNHRYVVKISG